MADVCTIPIRDYNSADATTYSVNDTKIIKLSERSRAIEEKVFRKSGNVVSEGMKNKANRMGKIINFSDRYQQKEQVAKGEIKPAKLSSNFIEEVDINSNICTHFLKAKKESTPISVQTPAPVANVAVEPANDVVINFNPEEIKQRVNDSFEQAEETKEERIEFKPIQEYTVDIPEEEKEEEVQSVRLPHAERSAKLDMSTMDDVKESEDNIISLQDYINKSSIEESELEEKKSPSVDQMIRNAYAENNHEEEFSYDNVTQEDIKAATYMNDGIEALVLEVKEETRRKEEVGAALTDINQQNDNSTGNYTAVETQLKQKEEEERRILAERRKVGSQKEEVTKLYETTLDATRKQLEAEKNRIINETRTLQKAYQNATEKASRIWTQTVETEAKISEIDARLPDIMQQTELDREEIRSIENRTHQIREMAKDVTGSEVRIPDSNITKFRTVDHNFDSIFDGVSPIDSSSRNSKSGYSKGKRAA